MGLHILDDLLEFLGHRFLQGKIYNRLLGHNCPTFSIRCQPDLVVADGDTLLRIGNYIPHETTRQGREVRVLRPKLDTSTVCVRLDTDAWRKCSLKRGEIVVWIGRR